MRKQTSLTCIRSVMPFLVRAGFVFTSAQTTRHEPSAGGGVHSEGEESPGGQSEREPSSLVGETRSTVAQRISKPTIPEMNPPQRTSLNRTLS